MKRLAIIALVAAALLTACDDGTCNDNGSSLPLAAFYADGNATTPVTVSYLTVRGIDAPGDSLLVDNQALSQLYLPLRATVNATQYAISHYVTDTGSSTLVTDTLSLAYRAIPYFHSEECGAMYNFEITSLDHTTHGIDSVTLTTPLITNAVQVSIKIFVKQ